MPGNQRLSSGLVSGIPISSHEAQVMKKEFSFFQRNGLTLVLLVLFVLSLSGQIVTGLDQYNSEIAEYGYPPVGLAKYFNTGHFIETTFENWESEFLQMG